MILSDISVKRPVLATVISLLLLAFGVLSFDSLPLREYPDIDSPVVSITTTYPGASADIVESKITQVIEDQVAGIEGIRAIESSSKDGRSTINIEFSVNRDVDIAANDVRDRVSRVLNNLPDEADPPEVSKAEADGSPMMWFILTSPDMNGLELTDYAERYLVDQLSVVDGVARIFVGGGRRYAMRVWLDPVKLAARGLTVADVEAALRAENVELPAGRLESDEREFSLRIARQYRTAEDFKALVLKRGDDGYLVRLGEVAEVELGAEEDKNEFRGNGEPMVGLGIVKQSRANTLEVARQVKAKVERIRQSLPEGMTLLDGSDDSVFIEAAISEVYRTLAIAIALVILVIYLFLGSVRAMLIPAVTVPVSLVGSFIVLAAFGYSVNLITLLALVLAIGLVVDDSIVVLENIHRRVEKGEPPLLAAFKGARQVAMPVVATTLVLVAVFVPLAFISGNVGRVFTELAAAMGGAVVISSIVALSLSPMMCSKLLRPHAASPTRPGGLINWVDRQFDRLSDAYDAALAQVLRHPVLVVMGMVGVLGLIVVLVKVVPQEFAPDEDRAKFFVMIRGPEGASFDYSVRNLREVERALMTLRESGEAKRVLVRVPGFGGADEINTGVGIVVLEDWDARERSANEIMREMFMRFQGIPGVFAVPVSWGGLKSVGGGRGKPVQFVIGGSTYEELAYWRDTMLERIARNPGLIAVEADLKETKPQILVSIDRDRAADLGISVQTIGRTLETMFNSRRVTTYLDRGEEYDVILEGHDASRRSPQDLENIYVRSGNSGALVPLSSLVTLEERGTAAALNRFNRLRAVTISANLAPGYTLGEALEFLELAARQSLPPNAQIDYKGESRELKDASGALIFTFGLAILVVFLVLAAQFESFVHPAVILAAVPLAVAGALVGLFLTEGTLNVYSNIGIIMLVGIAAKNGILIVEFTNQLRDAGRSFEAAIREACRIRLRPILMTAISTVIGALPLVFAVGAGSESRTTLGIVIFFGVSFATLFTLFVVPTFYKILARGTTAPGAVAAELDRLRDDHQPAE
ncbi:MAG: efflux RND transporter permease subunit [Alphaproteobacteria bacterium]|nr:MAG: efflux RND transporter permease subunit [Alphaproteobacteria bacterium]